MAIRTLTSEQIDTRVGERHPVVGFEYPPSGLQPYYRWLMGCLHLLGEASAGGLRVAEDEASPTHVHVAPGRLRLDGQAWSFGGQTLDLATFNNDTALVWAAAQDGQVVIATAPAVDGWPETAHLRLAEVALESGAIVAIVDVRGDAMLAASPGARGVALSALGSDVTALCPRHDMELITQGGTGVPSVAAVRLVSAAGDAIDEALPVRVRVCEADGWAADAHAVLNARPDTTVIEELAAATDLVLLAGEDGMAQVQVTRAVAGTVTLRVGPAPIGGPAVDCRASLNITHA